MMNKKNDFTPFDMKKHPRAQSLFLMPIVWGVSFFATRKFSLKIDNKEIKKLRPPYVVLSTHQGFSDYYVVPLVLFGHRANYVSDMEGYAAFGEKLYRAVGCIGKRRYVPELSVIKNIQYALDRKRIVVLFPEARHCNAGVNSLIPKNMGRLCKMLSVPVVTVSIHGSYLANPFWDESHTRKTKMEASAHFICDENELNRISAEELQKRIEEALSYNEYVWQKEKGIQIKEKNIAEGLHKVLYCCEKCGVQFQMRSKGEQLFCNACGAEWRLNKNGLLIDQSQNEKSIPDWYERERLNTIEEVKRFEYHADFDVNVYALPNEKGFIDIGTGKLYHTEDGFKLKINGNERFQPKTLFFSSNVMESVQIEYDYRGNGMCIVLSTRACCYYVYSKEENFNATKLQFAAEYFHYLQKQRKSCGKKAEIAL